MSEQKNNIWVFVVIALVLGLTLGLTISNNMTGNSIFGSLFGGRSSALGKNQTNQTNQTHNECVDYRCTKIVGPGSNQCWSNNDCINQTNQTNQTHNECISYRCVKIVGPGISRCWSNSDCNWTNSTEYAGSSLNGTNQTNCTDTDGGIVPYVFGIVNPGNYRDFCWKNGNQTNVSNATNVLAEFYCWKGSPQRTLIYCPNGCSGGRCLNTTVNDTSPGARIDLIAKKGYSTI
jgi:hypothetical protein